MIPRVVKLYLLVCIAALIATPLAAATVSYQGTVPLTTTNWTRSVSIPLFDQDLGTLLSVKWVIDGHVEGTLKFENTDAASATIGATLAANIILRRPDSSPLASVMPSFTRTETVDMHDGIIDYGGPSGRTYAGMTADTSNGASSTAPADLALFTGTGAIVLPVRAVGASTFSGAGNIATMVLTKASAVVTVTYEYVPHPPAAIGDRVWWDANNNGVQEAEEPGVPGINVVLYDVNNTPVASTLTDASGCYSFTGLKYGTYHVGFVAVGYAFTSADQGSSDETDSDADPQSGMAVSTYLAPGESDLTWDAGLVGLGSVGDTVWADRNRNGIQDNEPGIAGAKVILQADVNADGLVDYTASMLTDSNGYYQFGALPAGNYTVSVDPTTVQGLDPTYDLDGLSTPNTAKISLAPGESNQAVDFGYAGNGALGDCVWWDADLDGIQDVEEPGIAGITVSLFDSRGAVVDTTTTDVTGHYSFTYLFPASYTIGFTAPGYDFTPRMQGADSALDSDADPVTGTTGVATVTANTNDVTWDAGLIGKGSIGDTVWFDANGDGCQDSGEPVLPGVKVILGADLNGDGSADYTATSVTDANGLYHFGGLPAGGYRVSVDASTLPQGLRQTYDLDGIGTANTTVVALSAGQNRTDVDFGYIGTASLGDRVWNDINGDGVQDSNEPGINGVTVVLKGSNGATMATTTTAGDGLYAFTGLTPGAYTVCVVASTLPAGYVETYELDRTLNGCTSVNLNAGENRTDVDFGYRMYVAPKPGSIGDLVWIDSNANGLYEPATGELGVNGVRVDLYNAAGSLVATTYTTTNAATGDRGWYMFTDLPAGRYTVRVAAQNFTSGGRLNRYAQTYDYDRVIDGKTQYGLSAGETFLSADFGYRPACTPGTGTPGYWKNHPEAWPVDFITIGGVTYSKAQAIAYIRMGDGDKSLTLFRALVCAKLNVGVGNPYSCIQSTIVAADQWMAQYGPVGSRVKANSAAWRIGEPLYLMLDKYNNGLLGVPHRD